MFKMLSSIQTKTDWFGIAEIAVGASLIRSGVDHVQRSAREEVLAENEADCCFEEVTETVDEIAE